MKEVSIDFFGGDDADEFAAVNDWQAADFVDQEKRASAHDVVAGGDGDDVGGHQVPGLEVNDVMGFVFQALVVPVVVGVAVEFVLFGEEMPQQIFF